MNNDETLPVFTIIAVVVIVLGAGFGWIFWLRRIGASMEKRTVETIDLGEMGERWPDHDIAIHGRRRMVSLMRYSYTFLALIYITATGITAATQAWGLLAMSLLGVIMFGGGATYCWTSDWIGLRADMSGLHVAEGFKKKCIPWSDVCSCDIVTIHNVYGRFIKRLPIFRDAAGKSLFRSELALMSQVDIDRLLQTIRETAQTFS